MHNADMLIVLKVFQCNCTILKFLDDINIHDVRHGLLIAGIFIAFVSQLHN